MVFFVLASTGYVEATIVAKKWRDEADSKPKNLIESNVDAAIKFEQKP